MAVRGRQAAVAEGSFLQFLRSVGYNEELPPSTVAWLESAPVFKFLANKLSKDNFVSAKDQQEYNEIMMAKCPNADLYDALGSGSDDEEAVQEYQQQTDHEPQWMCAASDADVQRKVQAKEQEIQLLEQQISSLKALSGQLDASTQAQRSKQPMYINLQAHGNQQLSAARTEANNLNDELNQLLQHLSEVCSTLSDLAQHHPEQWLLCAADLGSYGEQDDTARQLFDRAMRLLNAAGVVRQLDPTASPALGATAASTPAGSPTRKQHQQQHMFSASSPKAAGDAAKPSFPSALIHTPSRQAEKQQLGQQQMAMLTPRGRGKSNREAELLGADIKRHADQESRNAALLRELTRQRLAFKLALDNLLKAEVAEAGIKAQLAAARDVKSISGTFARLRQAGPASVAQLLQDVTQLEELRQLLGSEQLPGLTEDLARLNDTYIVAGDYDRQLHKMSVAAQRKQAVLAKLLDVTSRHLLLLLLGSQERSRLNNLAQEMDATRSQLEKHVDAVRARTNRCAAAINTLQQAQQRSILQADDSYLLALTAASNGNLVMQPSTADDNAAATGGAEPATPTANNTSLVNTPRSARTPSYMPVSNLTNQLQHLASGMQQSSNQLQQLLTNLPQQLDSSLATAQRLHNLAFPPGQTCAPLVPQSHSHVGGTSSNDWDAASSAAASTAPSLRSIRSATSSSGTSSTLAMHNHPLPLLRVPEVAEAQSALEEGVKQFGIGMAEVVERANRDYTKLAHRKNEYDTERSVMQLFHNNPEELPRIAAGLQAEIDALKLARELEHDHDVEQHRGWP